MSPILPKIDAAALVVIDVQERFMPAMPAQDTQRMLRQCRTLIEAFDHFGGQVFYSEHYPKGLGATVDSLLELLEPKHQRVEKIHFSLAASPAMEDHALPRDVVLCGIEAHVCVLLTARDLVAAGHQVWIPFDAVASRKPDYRDNGLELARAAGATIINTESLVFSALNKAGTADFKKFSKLIR